MTGKRLGPYEILDKIGAGGMGEVYRAQDTRLGREVAVKVLPAGFSSDPERLRRFEQEARAAGVLNHPNILAIYDVGTHEGSPYVVSELLEGETLRDRMEGSSLLPRKAVEIALQIAHGLAAAHERGIVHRDLKPENLFVTRDGHVKILDFGLAKLTRPEQSGESLTNLPTTPARTDSGVILGTASYMSPEQVRGQPADHRCDLFTFGTILYEMLSGQRAFRRDSKIETMNAILKEEPPELSGANRNVPLALERIIRHCLEKKPEERFQSARDLAFDLETVSGSSGTGPAPPSLERAAARGRLRSALAVGALVAVAAAGAFWAGLRAARPAPVSPPTFQRLTFRRGMVWSARFDPDGRNILYSAAWDAKPIELFSTRSDSPESRPLGIQDADLLSISTSGEMAILLERRFEVGWMSRGTLARVSLAGGAPRQVSESVQDADWSPDGKQLAVARFGSQGYRLEFPAGTVLYESAGWLSHPRVSPDGERVVFLDHPQQGDDGGSVTVVDREGKKTTLSPGWASLWGAVWSPAGDEVWFTGSQKAIERGLYAVDLQGRLRLMTEVPGAMTLLDVFRDGRVLASVSNMRREIMGLPAGETKERNLSWLEWSFPSGLSADGRMLLFTEQGSGGGPAFATYIRNTDGSPAVRLGEGLGVGVSPDGRWALAIRASSPPPLALLPTGAGDPRPLEVGALTVQFFGGWFPDGKRIFFGGNEPGHKVRLYVMDLEGGKPRALTPEGVFLPYGNAISPDGKWLVGLDPDQKRMLYSTEGAAPRPLPGMESSRDDPTQWSSDGRFLYVYRVGDLPARVDRLEIATGRRELWKQLQPADTSGVVDIGPIFVTPDGKSYIYGFKRVLGDLYLIKGLK